MGSIVWLASYPKSGNTWLRIFLANLLYAEQSPVDINDIPLPGGSCSDRNVFDQYIGVDSSDLTELEINRIRPRYYESMASKSPGTLFCKCHEAYSYTDQGEPLLSKTAGSKAVYLVRNPLDVAVSWAYHNGATLSESVTVMADSQKSIEQSEYRFARQLRQLLMDWSGHVCSWLDEPGLDICLVRYEDMALTPGATFSRIVQFLELDYGHDAISHALDASAFIKLQQMETENGFKEKSPHMERFFRNGRIGQWRQALSSEDVQNVISTHRTTMALLGYLCESGTPAY